MKLKKPTKEQAIFLASEGLKPENWDIEKQTKQFLYVVNKKGMHRLLMKRKRNVELPKGVDNG